MALFQKRTDVSRITGLYTLGANNSVLIVGLGNPGKEYSGTRHNIGFEVLDFFASSNDFPGWQAKKDLKCELAVHTLGGTRVILCKPTTFMNLSGEAVQAVQRFYRVYNPKTLAVYDELAIPFGQIRTRVGGGAAGHNGVKSLIQHIDDDFSRLRIGIGNDISEEADASDFVLGKYSKKEQEGLPLIYREAGSLMSDFIAGNFHPETRAAV